jgi:uncharacterized YigZ family protein
MVFSYKTIAAPAEGMFKDKGSKFLAFAYPVESEQGIREKLEFLRKKYFDARHHCYAWMVGPEKKMYRANDDGEPNHSAGDPILGQIKSKDITNVMVVVVRYFGGVKLGVGGLIAAYKAATEDALNNASVIECEVREVVTLRFHYANTAEVMRMVKEFDLTIQHQDFTETCSIIVSVALRQKPAMDEKLRLLNALGVLITTNT